MVIPDSTLKSRSKLDQVGSTDRSMTIKSKWKTSALIASRTFRSNRSFQRLWISTQVETLTRASTHRRVTTMETMAPSAAVAVLAKFRSSHGLSSSACTMQVAAASVTTNTRRIKASRLHLFLELGTDFDIWKGDKSTMTFIQFMEWYNLCRNLNKEFLSYRTLGSIPNSSFPIASRSKWERIWSSTFHKSSLISCGMIWPKTSHQK